jgi:hypothetical protein
LATAALGGEFISLKIVAKKLGADQTMLFLMIIDGCFEKGTKV